MTSLSKFQGRTVNYGSVRADQNSEKVTSDKRVILQAQSTKITQIAILKCILVACAATLAFLKVAMRVCGVCMEHIACHLVILQPSGTHYSPFVRGQHIMFFGGCVYNILHHGTLEILQLCHLGICMCTMEAHTGLIEYP